MICTRKQPGFSLLELMITLAVGGVLLLVAFPSFNNMITGQRLKTQANDTLSAILYAKSEALKRRSTVSICAMKTNVDNQCGSSATEWANGWVVFDDLDGDGVVDNGEDVLKNFGDYQQLTSTGSITVFTFDNEGIADGSGDIEFCYSEAVGNKMRRVSMTPAGNPSITAHAECS